MLNVQFPLVINDTKLRIVQENPEHLATKFYGSENRFRAREGGGGSVNKQQFPCMSVVRATCPSWPEGHSHGFLDTRSGRL